MSSFSILTAWLYPTFLAPLFNKFKPLEDGELKTKIFDLAERVKFNATGLSVMDASVRSSHGNAYFTGVFGKKRIVLFDTLIEALNVKEVVAVLAHELGHFKLHHVRWMLIRSIAMTGFTFFLLSLALPLEQFYAAFKLQGVSNYGALVVFSLWFGLIDFVLSPIETYLSRRNEFAADAFALSHIEDKNELAHALLKLREKSHSMPISHPWFSGFYYSHPPMMERLQAMGFGGKSPL
jgi:STE24 endopeptidase